MFYFFSCMLLFIRFDLIKNKGYGKIINLEIIKNNITIRRKCILSIHSYSQKYYIISKK